LFDSAVDQKGLAVGKSIGEISRRAIPDQIYAPAIILQRAKKQLAAPPRVISLLQREQTAGKARLLSCDRGGDTLDLAAIFIAKRQMKEQIFDGSQPE
jgi:hypothetical protein